MGDSFVARLRKLDLCDLSDALDALGLTPSVTGLRPTTVVRPIAGRAVTVKLEAGSHPGGPGRHLCTGAIEAGGPDDVIVVEQATGVDAAGWGGLLSRAAQRRGIAGTIVEGPARDIEEAASLGYPVYARTTTARTARGRVYESSFQVPIRLGDAPLAPGDYVAADRSGAVAIPAAEIGRVLDKAEEIMRKSEAMAAAVDADTPVSEVMGGAYETMLQGAN
jgi:regulator of RNase E activity RraA